MSRIGGVIAAQSDFIYDVAIYFPYLIVGVLCIICTIGVFQLPDTIDKDLEDFLHYENGYEKIAFCPRSFFIFDLNFICSLAIQICS